jgi:hypothetical protein
MSRIEYEHPLAPQRPDRIAPGDKARREQKRQGGNSMQQGTTDDKPEPESADKKDREKHTEGLGHLVDLEV